MAKSDHESQLTLYKTYYGYKYFGEALLNAAKEGHLGSSHINDVSIQEVLWQLGIGLGMTRDQITICLSRLTDQHSELISYFNDGYDDIQSTRVQLRCITNSAICYAEQDMPEGNSIEVAEAFA